VKSDHQESYVCACNSKMKSWTRFFYSLWCFNHYANILYAWKFF